MVINVESLFNSLQNCCYSMHGNWTEDEREKENNMIQSIYAVSLQMNVTSDSFWDSIETRYWDLRDEGSADIQLRVKLMYAVGLCWVASEQVNNWDNEKIVLSSGQKWADELIGHGKLSIFFPFNHLLSPTPSSCVPRFPLAWISTNVDISLCTC